MSMQPSFSGSDVNPFKWIANKLGQYPKEPSEYDKAMQMHQAHYAAHQYGMEAASHQAALQEEAAKAEHGRNMEFFGSVLRHAKHETPIHLSMGDINTQFTKKPKQTRTQQPAAEQETPKPPKVVQRDPKTGRAMKAE